MMLNSDKIRVALERLHSEASRDKAKLEKRRAGQSLAQFQKGSGDLIRLGDVYMAVSPDEGRFLYQLARISKAKTIVEFGSSYGISSIYLAAAASENSGHLFTTEVHPAKCASLRKTIGESGLAPVVTVLEGDARETLKPLEASVDLVFLDGWKGAYVEVFDVMQDKLSKQCVIVADNCDHPAAQSYLQKISAPDSGFVTTVLGDLAISSRC